MSKINVDIVEQNRMPLSIIGSNLGKSVFKPESRDAIADYEAKLQNNVRNGNPELMLNRSPRYFSLKSVDITGIIVSEDISGTPVVKINPHDDGTADVILPISDMSHFGKTVEDAVKEALKTPEKCLGFNDSEKLCTFLNTLNNAEERRIDNLIADLQRYKQTLNTFRSKNERIAKTYVDQLKNSTPKQEINLGENTVVNINVEA